MENHEKEQELYSKFQTALGPAQKLLYLKELIVLYKQEQPSERVNDAYLEALQKSLEISNADPALWFEFGEAAFALTRLPLALYAFRSACSLSSNPPYLYSYSLTLALTHDYVNSLAIANYLLETFNYEEAQKIKQLVHFRLTGEGSSELFHASAPKILEEPEVLGVKKIYNLYNLCVTIRLLAFNQDSKLYLYEKGDQGAPKKKKNDKYMAPDCKFWEILEKYKLKILEKTNSACFGYIPTKLFTPSLITSKVSARFEPEISQFLDRSLNYRKLSEELIKLLCKNTPRPSTLLSDEVSIEILKIYSFTKEFLFLDDEYLTLLEMSIKEAHELIIELRNKIMISYKLNDSLNVRCFTALAQSYFITRDSVDKHQGTRSQQLYNAFIYAEKALKGIGEESWYLWWSDSFINKSELQMLIEEISLEYECIEMEKQIKNGTRLAQSTLGLLDKLTRIVSRLKKLEDPPYYWKKMKLVLKNIHKFQLTGEQNEIFAVCMNRYIAVLVFTLENGTKVNNDHDIKGLLKILTKNLDYSKLSAEVQCQIIVSTINLLRHCNKNFTEIPFFFKKVFNDLDPEFLPTVFTDFHSIMPKIDELKHDKSKQKTGKIDSKFHVNLCKKFEESCSVYKSSNLEIIYNWLYGLGSKKCECKLFYPSSAVTLPNSSNKLLRIINFLEIDWLASEEFPSDTKILTFFSELYSKEPKFFVTCKLIGSQKIEELVILNNVHTNCCSEFAREVAKKAYKRYGVELIGLGIQGESKDFAKQLKNAAEVLGISLSLDPLDCDSWALLALALMWRWVLGYYDANYAGEQIQAGEEQAQLSLQCFDKALLTNNHELKVYCSEHKAVLLYLIGECDKNKLGFCIQNFPVLETKKILIIRLMLRSKSKENLSFVESKIKHPIAKKINYQATGQEVYLKQLEDSRNVIGKYFEGKIKKNWMELLENNFLALEFPCKRMEIHRTGELWKIRRKFGEKCLGICKIERNAEKVKDVIAKFSALCVRSKKNKEVMRVVCGAIRVLCLDLGEIDLAKQEIDKCGILNSKEKQALRQELFPNN